MPYSVKLHILQVPVSVIPSYYQIAYVTQKINKEYPNRACIASYATELAFQLNFSAFATTQFLKSQYI